MTVTGIGARVRVHAIIFAALVSAFMAGCLIAAPASAQEVLVGQVGSQTNIVTGANGRGMNIGMNAYFASLNAQGGVNGRQIKVVFKEDDGNAGKMIAPQSLHHRPVEQFGILRLAQ